MRKVNKKQILAVGAAWLMALGMIGCQTAAPDPTETTGELLVVTTDATEPEKEVFVSSSRYQATLPTEPPKPTEEAEATEPTEGDTAETSTPGTGTGSTGSSGTGSSGSTAEPAPTDPPADPEPAPTETAPPATEAPAVSLDYAAAAAYGDSYAASTYGCIVDPTLTFDNAGYDFPGGRSLEYYANNGGQAALNADVAWCVDDFASRAGCAFNISCCVYESNGWVNIYVLYG